MVRDGDSDNKSERGLNCENKGTGIEILLNAVCFCRRSVNGTH